MSGFIPTTPCEPCNGKGRKNFFNKKWMRETWETCRHCNGSGYRPHTKVSDKEGASK